jgi:hypothetical protein
MDGWKPFDSRVSFPDLSPSFTLSYPPSFSCEPETDASGSPSRLRDPFLNFRLYGTGFPLAVQIDVFRAPWPQKARDAVRRIGQKAYWTSIGESQSSGRGGRFEGARTFVANGLACSELLFSGIPLPESAGRLASFGATRSVIAGDWHYVFCSTSIYGAEEAGARGYAAASNPLYLDFVKPMFDSITFRP